MIEEIKRQARKELDEERRRAMIEQYKEKLRKKSCWDVLFPWKIIVIKKEKL